MALANGRHFERHGFERFQATFLPKPGALYEKIYNPYQLFRNISIKPSGKLVVQSLTV